MSGVGDKINGAIQMVQGIGDQIRGSLMETLDTSLSSISNSSNDPNASQTQTHSSSRNAELWNKGKEEYRQGRAKVAGVPAAVGDGVQPEKEGASVGGEGSESERPPINPHEAGQVGHGDRSVGVVPGGGRVLHPDA
ncbi:hypothetical protein GLOTRDRAFT_131643 [Gloeophyllum trabeum ATCC 11539]|uniref:Uncharacterized protein n=1 Tax=Gloeophyllum trabeum (strain ATCC 11539 / FP-39264 / Madison 617) TaxID=670483 RepID=S7RL27_GLOTA|nr:uncharacterized protein GLOTRDRAFT_131643 [Gloeophyllum trabeum ATCC 11539]EPQ53374.1 hypothetical protein GLOTRDRAFT_131643 [Gloeophyllum trabeum ATCC 11539]